MMAGINTVDDDYGDEYDEIICYSANRRVESIRRSMALTTIRKLYMKGPLVIHSTKETNDNKQRDAHLHSKGQTDIAENDWAQH